jgi:hypothetical protein
MSGVDVQVELRGSSSVGQFSGAFRLILAELAQDGRIQLVCKDDAGARLSLWIRSEILEDVHAARPVDQNAAWRVESELLDRLAR